MLKSVLSIALALAIAILGGAFSVRWALEATHELGSLKIGQWSADPALGTAEANPYARARFAQQGGFTLGQAEGIAFAAETDAAGHALQLGCQYRLEGPVPAARFFTLHADHRDGSPVAPVGQRRAALNSTAMLREPNGDITVETGPHPLPGNWLATSGTGAMRLVLTLFDTPVSGEVDSLDITLPRITLEGCGSR